MRKPKDRRPNIKQTFVRAIFQTITTGGLIARRQIRGATTPTKHATDEEGPPTIAGGLPHSTRICRSCARSVG